MSLQDRIEEALEYYDYVLVTLKGESTENVVVVKSHTTIKPLFHYLTIVYGAERVSMFKGKIRIKNANR